MEVRCVPILVNETIVAGSLSPKLILMIQGSRKNHLSLQILPKK